MSPQDAYLRRIGKDPFLKYFKSIQGPNGATGFARRLNVKPDSNYKDPGVTRQSADLYKEKTGKAYTGALLGQAEDSTYKTSSFGIRDAAAQKQKSLGATGRSQKTLFGGKVATLFPSQRRDLTRRRSAKRQAIKAKKVLGV